MTSVKWLGKVRDGKDGSMYLGESPERMKLLSVGVRFRCRKSARKPSSEMRSVVGAKVCVPFESVFAMVVGVVLPVAECSVDEAL